MFLATSFSNMSEYHEPILILECNRDTFYAELDQKLQEMGKGSILSESSFNDILAVISHIKECSFEEECLQKLRIFDKKVTYRWMKNYDVITNSDSSKVLIYKQQSGEVLDCSLQVAKYSNIFDVIR